MRDAKIILGLVFLSTTGFGQIQRLIDDELIRKKDKAFFVGILDPTDRDPYNYLLALTDFQYKKMAGKHYGKEGSYTYKAARISKRRKIQFNYLLKLKKAGLINDSVFRIELAEIKTGKYLHLHEMMQSLLERVERKSFYVIET